MGTATTKGKKAPREDVRCSECDNWFNRCSYHPYITKCPKCRKGKPLKRERFECCGEIWKHKRGIFVCCKCGRHWWSFGDGWYRLDHDLYFEGKFVGTWEGYGDYRRLINEYKKAV